MKTSIKNVGYGLLLATAAALVVLSMLHTAFGVTFPLLVVKSGSMRPVIEVGDIIIVLPVNPSEIKADPVDGDVIVFYRPGEKGSTGSIIVHRAVARVTGGFITKGDANAAVDYWGPVPFDHVIGRWTGYSIPSWTGIGFLSLFLRGEIYFPIGPFLVLILIILNIYFIVKDFSRSRSKKTGGDESTQPSASIPP
ncbi:MAG: signal peptidase I [Candidatus Caldarchaeum sp.]|nr:signal peptidase I [Candidatus Caldarchaeum sp.]MCX8200763.1 signal peptidase I [Candidatus Caldarchaeum sp.]MDW8063311.1 signal peptidase I [Candidatus Caldarchaeum sp.]MDW8434732.1 signal peptidase I [Candidatus Caldarchaeum sp.]